jgi:hypothetical protein
MEALMKRLIAVLAAVLGLTTPVAAQQILTEYYTTLSPMDVRNSSGARLTDFCAVLQQDRANYHRFGRRDDGDQGDPIFGSREMRAQIAGRCRIAAGSEYVPEWVLTDRTRYVRVLVYGQGNSISFLLVSEGAG